MSVDFKLDANNLHIENCAAYGGFPCDCQARVERAILSWTRDFFIYYGEVIPGPAYKELDGFFTLLEKATWR